VLPDMDELPMDPPLELPFCNRCGLKMSVRADRRTGKRAAHGWKAVLQCTRCKYVTIGQDAVAWGRRFKLVRGLIVAGVGFGFLFEALLELRRVPVATELSIIIGLAACACFFVHAIVTCAAHGLSPQVPAKLRFEHWFMAAFWSAPLGFLVYAFVTAILPLLRAPRPPS
jgi:hypothetical protein